MGYIDKYLPRKSGLVGKSVHAAVGAVVPAALIGGFGYVQNRYRDKAHVGNVPIDLAAGIVGTALATFGGSFRLTRGLTGIGHAFGVAGLGAYAHTVGAGLGAQKAGVTRVAVDKKDVHKIRAAVPSAEVLGAIPHAPHGDFLSGSQLAALAK